MKNDETTKELVVLVGEAFRQLGNTILKMSVGFAAIVFATAVLFHWLIMPVLKKLEWL